MFLDEARLAARIQHANVAQVYDIGRNEHGLYFTMEYVHGEDLRGIMNAALRRDGALPLEHALTIAVGRGGRAPRRARAGRRPRHA